MPPASASPLASILGAFKSPCKQLRASHLQAPWTRLLQGWPAARASSQLSSCVSLTLGDGTGGREGHPTPPSFQLPANGTGVPHCGPALGSWSKLEIGADWRSLGQRKWGVGVLAIALIPDISSC